ncbi:MAG: hypothetical protein IJZ34_16085 [Lachnospiraceae bacterium]|nr:hypothetical protein [Lachnospiraceae bacterium]
MRKWIQKLRYKAKLRQMDDMWRWMGGSCWGLFPPSFYLTHTQEEIQRRKKAELDKLKAMLEEYKEKNGL